MTHPHPIRQAAWTKGRSPSACALGLSGPLPPTALLWSGFFQRTGTATRRGRRGWTRTNDRDLSRISLLHRPAGAGEGRQRQRALPTELPAAWSSRCMLIARWSRGKVHRRAAARGHRRRTTAYAAAAASPRRAPIPRTQGSARATPPAPRRGSQPARYPLATVPRWATGSRLPPQVQRTPPPRPRLARGPNRRRLARPPAPRLAAPGAFVRRRPVEAGAGQPEQGAGGGEGVSHGSAPGSRRSSR